MTMEYFEKGVSLVKDLPYDLLSYPRVMPLTADINNMANLCQIILWQTSSSELFLYASQQLIEMGSVDSPISQTGNLKFKDIK